MLFLIDLILELSLPIFYHTMPVLFHWLICRSIIEWMISIPMVSLTVSNTVFLRALLLQRLLLLLLLRGIWPSWTLKVPPWHHDIWWKDILLVYVPVRIIDSKWWLYGHSRWTLLTSDMVSQDSLFKERVKSWWRWSQAHWNRLPWHRIELISYCRPILALHPSPIVLLPQGWRPISR